MSLLMRLALLHILPPPIPAPHRVPCALACHPSSHRRNFVMNPQNGLKIRPYKRTHLNRESDQELFHLTRYLTLIAPLEKISHLNHKRWEEYLATRR